MSNTPHNATRDTTPSLSAVFSALANSRRRTVLRRLLYFEGGLSIAQLAEHVAADTDGDSTRVHTELRHLHVPELEDVNLVTYDREDDEIALTDDGNAIEPLLALAAQYDDAPEP